VQPGTETCNNLDDDCDGQTDDGDPGGGTGCNTGLPGVCAAGTNHCQGGQVQCVQNVQASGEVCDGLDNNCSGAADEGDPGGGGACSTGLLGVCAAGTVHCQNGALACVQNVQAQPSETCSNGLDDDCDGQTDEGCSSVLELDIGLYGTTYSAGLTRGYWFTAPVNFTIVGLRVPTDVGTDVQNVAVVRFTNPPIPIFSATTNDFVTLAYERNIPGTAFIPVNIAIQSGQVIGVLGARGTTTMNNSYSQTNPYNSSIGGHAVQLTRMGFQDNLYNVAPHDIFQVPTGSAIGRVEMQYHL
jgi:hypothetical protein